MKTFRTFSSLLMLLAVTLFVGRAPAEDAKDLYKAKCAACHGADGKGDTAAGKKLGTHDFHAPDVQKETDAALLDIVKKGKNKMPAYATKLSDDQIKQLLQYVRELGNSK